MSKEAMKLALEALKELVAQTEGRLFAVKHDHVAMQYARQAITALQEALAEQPAQQEPVAWLVDNGGDAVLIRHSENFPGVFAGSEFNKRPLVYSDTSPQPPAQRKPLTDEQIMTIGRELGAKCKMGGNPNIDFDYARAIEAAHGIKENT